MATGEVAGFGGGDLKERITVPSRRGLVVPSLPFCPPAWYAGLIPEQWCSPICAIGW